jgi:two-component system, chemotaxis family, protein-glutamate methylesterase/glutaminase
MTRVLIVDDSPTARALLAEIFRSDPGVEVVGEARDGAEGVEMARRLRPDVVTMDVRMPGLDGFAATKEIMITAPTPIVIVTASLEGREVEMAFHALRAGALTILRKPPGPGSPAFDESARHLLATVKAMAGVKVVRHHRPAPAPAPPPPPRGVARVVAVATSTGGPAALNSLLSDLPADFPAPLLVVQHITPGFLPGLARWLDESSDLAVKIAEHGEPLKPHTAYLAPDDRHLGVSAAGAVELSAAPPVGGFRPSGTFLFESVARAFGTGAVAVILTGMGQDGVAGLRAVRAAGGRVLAQDEKTSVIFGMPGAAVAAGLADVVLPLDALAPRLVELAGAGRPAR